MSCEVSLGLQGPFQGLYVVAYVPERYSEGPAPNSKQRKTVRLSNQHPISGWDSDGFLKRKNRKNRGTL